MNKLQGFYALEKSNLPSVPWRRYDPSVQLNPEILWTIRCAVMAGDDLNLPRRIGVDSIEAKSFADALYDSLTPGDLIIYYPYFIAIKSGVLDISRQRIAIEAVKDDLWNLVTYHKKDVTILFEEDDLRLIGNTTFLTQEEIFQLIDYCSGIKGQFQEEIRMGKNVMLEWSYAYQSNRKKEPVGKAGLIFYEIRTV